jgi:cardiolipin synthase
MFASCAQLSRASQQGSQLLMKNTRLSIRSNVFKIGTLRREGPRCVSTSSQWKLNQSSIGCAPSSHIKNVNLTLSRLKPNSPQTTLIPPSFFTQQRWSSSKSPENQAPEKYAELKPTCGTNPTNSTRSEEPKKKPILSRIPLPTSHENIYTLPNILTFSRLVAAPIVGYLLVHNYHAAALSLFAYAGITDLVDGWIARRYNLQTVVGTIIDPMADKLLMTIGVACLAVNGSLPGKFLIHTSPDGQTNNASLARGHNPRSGRRLSHLGYLLSLDLTARAKDHGPVLGFLAPLSRGQAYRDLEDQYRSAAGFGW